jgi:hypothetical protein
MFGRGIDRSKPSILSPQMPDHAWIAFCDDIDAAMESVAKAMKCAMICFGVSVASTLLVILVQIIVVFLLGYFGIVAVVFALPAVTMFISVFSFGNAFLKHSKACGDMNTICKEASDRHPPLTFRVKFDRYYYGYSFRNSTRHQHLTDHYIQVSVDGNEDVENVVPAAQAIVLPSQPTSALGGEATAQQRLKDLECAKHLLSKEEYERKRSDIIASI